MNVRGAAEACAGCGQTSAQAKKILPARKQPATVFICDKCVVACSEAIADAPTRIPGAARACAFCGKPEDHVGIIVAVGSKLICDECVDHYRSLV